MPRTKASLEIKMLRVEYEGDDPGPVIRAAGEMIGSMVGAVVGGGSQRTFEHLRTEQRGPRASRPRAITRELAHADARDIAERTAAGSTDPAKDAAIRALRVLLCDYLAGLGVGATFQSVNFTAWLDQTGQRPRGLDLRCLGGMLGTLLKHGYLVAVGFAPDGGNPHTPGSRHNSANRPVFRIARIPTP